MNMLVTAYSCRRRTLDILEISAYNALFIWMASEVRVEQREAPEETPPLEELGKVLVRPQVQRRQHVPTTPTSAAIMRRIQEENAGAPST